MSVIYLLISISLIIALLFLYAFFKAVKNGQFDDDYTPSVRILFDETIQKPTEPESETTLKTSENKKS